MASEEYEQARRRKGKPMHQLGDECVLFAFARDLEPALRVASGDTVRIRTQDCFGNQVQAPEDQLDEIDWDAINPATGPVYVEGAVPGGALKVSIDNIELDAQTASCTGKDEGVCGDRFDAWSTRLCAIEDGKLRWSDKLSIPLNPMIGVIGVAPEGEPVNCGTPGSHGGNMDNTAITTGATLYFPVAVEGALFGCGDMHAAMGDGEISVSGAEVAGWATVTLTALPDLHLADPLIENDTHFGVIYDEDQLARNEVPLQAAVYFDDMYVDSGMQLDTLSRVGNSHYWTTNEFEHDGLHGSLVFKHLYTEALNRGDLEELF